MTRSPTTVLVPPCQHCSEESQLTARLSQKTEEIWHVSYDSHQLLQVHQRKHSFWFPHSLVWLLLCPRLEGTTKGARVAQSISLSSTDPGYTSRCLGKAASIIKDPTHPGHSLFRRLLSGKRYKSLRSRTNRLKNSFFPVAVRLLNGATLY